MHWFAALTAVTALLLLSPPGAAASSSLSDGAAAGPAAPPSCTLVGDLQRGASSRGTNLTPEGLSGAAAATPQACQTACCAHTDCAAFTHSSSQRTATKNCAHGAPCCWLKGSYTSAIGDDNETSGQIHRPPNRASPASVPIRVLTDVTIVKAPDGPATNLTAGDHATCTLTAAAGGWERQPETFAGGVVLNASAVRCKVNASADLGGLASLTAVATCVCAPALALLCFSVTAFDACYSCSEIECRLCVCLYATHRNGGSLSADLHLHPSLSVSVGRQPYTDETEGSLLVRLSADAFPAAPTLTPAATLLVGGRQHALVLKGPKLQRGKTTVLTFSLAELPPTVGLLVGGEAENGNNTGSAATVTFEISGIATATPLPFVRLGDSRSSQSVLDYATGAVLTGPERVPLLPNGFDSHFSTASGADFDEVRKLSIRSTFHAKNHRFYQDRLGTNTGKSHQKGCFLSASGVQPRATRLQYGYFRGVPRRCLLSTVHGQHTRRARCSRSVRRLRCAKTLF
jgi:hypothetical protein